MTMDATEGGSAAASLTMTPPARQGSSLPLVKTMLEAADRSYQQVNKAHCSAANPLNAPRQTLLPNASVAQRSRGRTPHAAKQASDAAARLKGLGG
jgi:hypothetical protein